MHAAETLRQIVERHDIFETELQQRPFERHIGRRDDADGDAKPILGVFRHLVGMQQPDAGPGRLIREPPGIAVDHHDQLVAYSRKKIAGQPAQVSRAIERERHVRRDRRIGARRRCQFRQQHAA